MNGDPNWVDMTTIGSAYDEQLNVNAAFPQYRHRPHAFDGQPVREWLSGPAPNNPIKGDQP